MLRVEMKKMVLEKPVSVRKAVPEDLEKIIQIASSVGTTHKDSEQGFLVDDYIHDRYNARKKMRGALKVLDHFYVAEIKNDLVGFLMAYRKEQWLLENPGWIEAVHWHPGFKSALLGDFALVDKTAVRADLTGQGIGSQLYVSLVEALKQDSIDTLLAETIIDPVPNFASLNFRKKQRYQLAGMRYEFYNSKIYTDLVYYKNILT